MHGEDDLPPDFRKKLTEWEIRKAMVGKSQHNVEELQKNLGEDFNRKMAEWQRIKGHVKQSSSPPSATHSQVKSSASAGNIQAKIVQAQQHKSISNQGPVKTSASASQVFAKPVGPGSSPRLDRKGSAHKIKKMKSSKMDKMPLGKVESGHKGRDKTDKELQWLEKELLKVERETQRLEREKEKFLERQARLEKMRQAMGGHVLGGPARKKEIYIKTSTGEFRFEGISQTFTKRLYEWEERRGIRPESSTIALLDPNYNQASKNKDAPEKPRSPELVRLVRSKSESSMAADMIGASVQSQPSSLSLNEMDVTEDQGLQADNKAASEPTLAAEEPGGPKVAVLVQLEEVDEPPPAPPPRRIHRTPAPPYAPAEITRNIDSSGSDEDVSRRGRRVERDEEEVGVDGERSQGAYHSLLHENMSLLDKLRQQEDLCRELETKMGDLDSKMDNVADQHLRTLEKLHRQVTIMKDSGSGSSTLLHHHPGPEEGDEGEGNGAGTEPDDSEANQRLINQLKSRIVELEMKGDRLKTEKEQLERAFKLHKEHETEIAESLVERIRELQDAGAEVNIQNVQHDPSLSQDSATTRDEQTPEQSKDDIGEDLEKNEDQEKQSASKEDVEERRIKEENEEVEEGERKDENEEVEEGERKDENEDVEERGMKENEEVEERMITAEIEAKQVTRREGRTREHRRVKKVPPKKVQKLHNLTGDLLFQAKRLEQALVSKHGLDRRSGVDSGTSSQTPAPRQRSLRGQSSLRLTGESNIPHRQPYQGSSRTWSSIEAITFPADSSTNESESWEGGRGKRGTSGMTGQLISSRSFRGNPAHTFDPQDLLAMNAELSRMAKELRLEMMKMWSYRDSTSPESETSEVRSVHDLDENIAEKERLVAEANEVFQSIAMLQQHDTSQASPSQLTHPSSSTASLAKRASFEEMRTRLSFEDRDRSTPSRRDSQRKQKQCRQFEEEEEEEEADEEEEEDEEEDEKEPEADAELSVFLPGGATLGELLLRTKQHHDEEEEEEEEGRSWEVLRRRSSDGLSTVTSGPSHSHSPSPSIASSAPEAETSSRVDEDDDSISLPGTWRTTTTSTTRSAEYMISSSFEWEEEEEERKKPRGRWRAVEAEETEEEEEEESKHGEWKMSDNTGSSNAKKWKIADEKGNTRRKKNEEDDKRGRQGGTEQKRVKRSIGSSSEVDIKKTRGRWKADEENDEKMGKWRTDTEENDGKKRGKWKGDEENEKMGKWRTDTDDNEGKKMGTERDENVEKKGRWKTDEENDEKMKKWRTETEDNEGKKMGMERDENIGKKGRWKTDEENDEKMKKWRTETAENEGKKMGTERDENVGKKGRWKTDEENDEKMKKWRTDTEDNEGKKMGTERDESGRKKGKWIVADVEVEEEVKPKKRWRVVATDPEDVNRVAEETRVEVKAAGVDLPMKTPQRQVPSNSFETEVTVTISGARQRGRELRTRRISDTQVEYDSFGQSSKDECFANIFSKTVYDDEALTAGKLSRNPSVRRANSRDSDDLARRRLRALPSGHIEIQHIDKSPDVFVPTKRTIFTVQGSTSNPEQARATPTFVESQDEVEAESEGGTEGETIEEGRDKSENIPEGVMEGGKKPGEVIEGGKKHEGGREGHETRPEEAKKGPEGRREAQKVPEMRPEGGADTTTRPEESVRSQSHTKSQHKKITNTETQPDKKLIGTEIITDEMNGKTSNNPPQKINITHMESQNGESQTSQPEIYTDSIPQDYQNAIIEGMNSVDIALNSGHYPSDNSQSQAVVSTATAVTAALLQMPGPTSPPIESKKKVLEAANEGVPAVRNIIKKFNQRITENQELLGSPFRTPPSSPPWHSPRTQRKLLADLGNLKREDSPRLTDSTPGTPECKSHGGVFKSQSTSVITSSPVPSHQMQRSISGLCVQVPYTKVTDKTGVFSSPQLSRVTSEGWRLSPSISPAISPIPTDLDTSCDIDSVDNSRRPSQDRSCGSSQAETRSPTTHLRAMKLKRAKEEFLSRGAAPLRSELRINDDPSKMRHSSGTASTEDSWRESDEFCGIEPCIDPSPTSAEMDETREKPPRAAPRRRNIPKKDSFRRQSAGCLGEESDPPKHSSQVVKSASSGGIGSSKRHSRCSSESQSPDRRKPSIDPSVDSTRSFGLFRIFRRNRSKDKRDMPAVQRLCRQSLLVDFAGRRTQSASPQPPAESQLRVLPEVDGEDNSGAQSSKTLPRGSSMDTPPTGPVAPSHSCPSSPVAPRRSRTANWLARGRQIFQSRSPSPGKKPR